MYDIDMVYYIVGAGEFAREKFDPTSEDVVIAADAGILYTGGREDYAIGDWDSAGDIPKNVKCRTLPVCKDFTDLGEAVDYALEQGAQKIRLFGAGGGRTDHYLANLGYVAYLAEKGKDVAMVCPDCTISGLTAGGIKEVEKKGTVFSVIAARDKVRISISGARYNLDNSVMPASNPGLGISNVAENGNTAVTVHEGTVLVIEND